MSTSGPDELRHGFKVLTHDLRPPNQGGEPVFGGSLPVELPKVKLSRAVNDCAEGWNYTAQAGSALKIAGLWPDGWPSRVFEVDASRDAIERGEKRRASSLTLLRELSEADVAAAIADWFPGDSVMLAEQMAWRAALARPERSAEAVADGLRVALAKRGLSWKLRQFDTARAARAAWDARATWAAWDAWDALTVSHAARQGWTKDDPDLLTAGIRDAYAAGLAIAISTSPDELGWAMVPGGDRA